MAKILLYLFIFFVFCMCAIIVYEKIIHPILFKEELEDTLESAAEQKIKNEVDKKAKQILEDGNDAE